MPNKIIVQDSGINFLFQGTIVAPPVVRPFDPLPNPVILATGILSYTHRFECDNSMNTDNIVLIGVGGGSSDILVALGASLKPDIPVTVPGGMTIQFDVEIRFTPTTKDQDAVRVDLTWDIEDTQ